MKKTTVRFIAVGAILLLAALALALAQHDARQRPREAALPSKPVAADPEPILIDDNPLWGQRLTSLRSAHQGTASLGSTSTSASGTIIRANNDRDAAPPSLSYQAVEKTEADLGSTMPPSLNPLRGSSLPLGSPTDEAHAGDVVNDVRPLGNVDDDSQLRQAGGEGPPTGTATMPISPPGLGAAPLPIPALPLPSAANATGATAPPGWLQSPPAVPPSTSAPTSSNAMPSPSKSATVQSLSDTQRPAMPPTNLPSGNALGNPRLPGYESANPSANPAWMQSPPLAPNDGSSSVPAAGSASASQAGRVGGQLVTSPMPGSAASPSAVPIAGAAVSSLAPPPSATLGTPQPTGPSGQGSVSATNSGRGHFAGTVLGTLISNQPGNRHLDGSQNPIMLIQKRMAGECQVGKRATVVITVRNAGNSTAQDVEVIDSVPSGARFAEALPAVTPTPEGILLWKLGEMGPGDERTINLQIIPERQGEMGSTAAVRFAAQASMRTLATLPKLELTYHAVPEVLIGSSHSIDVTVKNVGTGVAKGVKLEADLPANVRHESGDANLEAVFGDIAPGESKLIRLDAIAAEPGAAVCALRALSEDGVQQEQRVDIRVLAAALQAAITGPSRRYLDRQATFEIMIKNTGTASATNCEFTLRLPAGLNFNSANKSGTYDATQHAVMWSVPEFPAGHAEPVELTVLPVEVGAQQMTFQGIADLGVKTETRGALSVEEQGELSFTIDQDADPIEMSASTTYTVEVRNVGRADRNVELSLQLPPGSQVLRADPPTARVEGDVLRFDPIPQMDGRSSQKFRVEVRHGKVGTQIVRAQLKSQNRPTLVIKEEATEVYNDRDP